MDAATMPELTVADHMPWVKMTLDYTEEIAALIPEDKLDWRPEDPSGQFCFSLAEIVMHCADARVMFMRQLSGEKSEDGYWCTSEGPDDAGVWKFKEHGGKQAILDSMKHAREEIDTWQSKPVDELLSVPEGCEKAFAEQLKKMKEHEKDTAEMERRGPASIMRVLMATATHEAGHRGSLQTLLRQHGINVKRDEDGH